MTFGLTPGHDDESFGRAAWRHLLRHGRGRADRQLWPGPLRLAAGLDGGRLHRLRPVADAADRRASVGPGWPVSANIAALGFSNGVYAASAIGAMMALSHEGALVARATRMGVWGAAQAIASALAAPRAQSARICCAGPPALPPLLRQHLHAGGSAVHSFCRAGAEGRRDGRFPPSRRAFA